MRNIFSSRPGSDAQTPAMPPKDSVDPPLVLNNAPSPSMGRLLSRVESSKVKAKSRTSHLNRTLESSRTGEANLQMFARVKVAPLPCASVPCGLGRPGIDTGPVTSHFRDGGAILSDSGKYGTRLATPLAPNAFRKG